MLRIACAFVPLTVLAAGTALIATPVANAGWQQDGGVICYASHSQLDPEIVPDTYGGAYVVWVDTRDGPQSDIYAQRVTSAGQRVWFHTGIPVCSVDGDQDEPAIVPDDAGGVIVVWADDRDGDADIYAQRIDRHGTALWTADGIAVSTADRDQYDPVIVKDGAGGVIIVWTDQRNFDLQWSLDLYAQRLNADGTKLWSADGVEVYANLGSQSKPDVLTDGSGGAFVAWQDTRNDTFENPFDYDIYAAHVTNAGSVGWDREILVVLYSQSDVRLVPDSEGGILLFWTDQRDQAEFEGDIYGSRCRADGTLLVPSDTGRMIVHQGEPQSLADVVTDGSGGAILFWYHDNGADNDIRAQRVNDDLDGQWGSGGIGVCEATEFQTDLRAIHDAYGGAIAVWVDRRNASGRDIYAQRIDGTGAGVWETDGMPICLQSTRELMPALCTDSAGGGLMAWHDERLGTVGDIYGHHARSNGTLLPTFLRSSEARWVGDAVRLAWRVSDDGAPWEWLVERTVASDGAFRRLELGAKRCSDGEWVVKDTEVAQGETVRYRVSRLVEGSPELLFLSGPVTVPLSQTRLLLAKPNPFNPTTNLEFELVRAGSVRLAIYDLAGREVRVLTADTREAGRHRLSWDGRDKRGHALPSGVYIARLATGDRVDSVRLSLVR